MRALLTWLRRDDSAIGPLRVLLVLSILGPVALFAVAATLTYRAAFRDADGTLARISAVAREHASKVFDTHQLIADRVEELLAGLDEDAIRRSEAQLHAALHRLVANLPQVQSVLVIGKDGRGLVSADVYPVPRGVDFSDRDYFQALRDRDVRTYVTTVMIRRFDGAVFFGLAHRHDAPDGRFGGVVDISVSPDFFASFYATLLGENPAERKGTVITLVRDDGQVIARYPPFVGTPPRAAPSSPFFDAIRAHSDGGHYISHSVIDADAPERRFAYDRVPGRPLYVVSGRSTSAIITEWWWMMASHLMFGVPATIALYAITLVALRRTQRERAATIQAREEMMRREAAEDALRQAQKLEALGQLTAGVAHDFNNLLTIIVGNLELMARSYAGDARGLRRIDSMRSAAERGSNLTSQLLAFSRRQRLVPQPIDLNAIMSGMGEMLRSTLGDAVRIETALHIELWPALVDRTQFELAMLNLAINARDAMGVGGTLTIATANATMSAPMRPEDPPAGDHVMVSVSDTGSGMTPDVLAKAFEPFFTTKAIGRGSGLGLSQVYGFAQQSGGGVQIDSVVGEGTNVRLYLPRAPAASLDVAPQREALASGLRHATILVVDDDADVRLVTASMLVGVGFTVFEAASSAAALDWMEREPAIELVVMDYAMPVMNGIETARRMRARRPDLSVLFVTGYAENVASEVREAGDMLLQKPFTSAQLVACVAGLLGGTPAGESNVVSLRGT